MDRTTQAALWRRLLVYMQSQVSKLRPGSRTCFNARVRDHSIQLFKGAGLSLLSLALTLAACREGSGVEDVHFAVDGVWPREGTGVFLNEAIASLAIVGIAAIIGGIYTISWRGNSIKR